MSLDGPDEIITLASEETPEGGVIRLERWTEGYALWHHGMIVWRSWRAQSRNICGELQDGA